MNTSSFKYSWLEAIVTVVILLIIARIIWAKEVMEYENYLLAYIGISENMKYILTIPLAAYFYYRIYKKESIKAKANGTSVISKPVVIFSSLALIFIVVYFTYLSIYKNA
jgi:hypothetical protein